MLPMAAAGGQGTQVQGGDAGPATGTQTVNPSAGALTFNFNAPSAGLFGSGTSGTIIKGTLALVALIGVVALGRSLLEKKK